MIWLYGALNGIGQAVLLRELAILYQGNEITIGLLLFFWLAGTGLGSYAFGKLPENLRGNFM